MKTHVIPTKIEQISYILTEIPPHKRTIRFKHSSYFVDFDFHVMIFSKIFHNKQKTAFMRATYPLAFGSENSFDKINKISPFNFPHIGPTNMKFCTYNHGIFDTIHEIADIEANTFLNSNNYFYMTDGFNEISKNFEFPVLNKKITIPFVNVLDTPFLGDLIEEFRDFESFLQDEELTKEYYFSKKDKFLEIIKAFTECFDNLHAAKLNYGQTLLNLCALNNNLAAMRLLESKYKLFNLFSEYNRSDLLFNLYILNKSIDIDILNYIIKNTKSLVPIHYKNNIFTKIIDTNQTAAFKLLIGQLDKYTRHSVFCDLLKRLKHRKMKEIVRDEIEKRFGTNGE